jgi:hypothetical protein
MIMIRRIVNVVAVVAIGAANGLGLPGPAAGGLRPAAGRAPLDRTSTLSVKSRIALPITSDGFPSVAAEGPGGSVFVSDPAHGRVWVVGGDGRPTVAEHVAGVTNALAVDGASLFVANFSAVYRYDRRTGAKLLRWSLPPAPTASSSNALLVSLTVVHSTLWVFATRGNDVNVYRINPNSRRPPVLVVRTLGAVVSNGGFLFYERTDGYLVRVADGKARVGPRLADRPNGLGGGVDYIDSVAGGRLWVTEPAGQGLDASYYAYDSTTLVPDGAFHGTVGDTMVNSRIGTLMLSGADRPAVQRIDGDGRQTDRLPVVGAKLLVGLYPAVLATNGTGTALVLDRLS